MRSLAIVMLCALTSCTSAQISSATSAATDAAAFVSDLTGAVNSAVATGSIPSTTLTAAQTQLAQLQQDAAALATNSSTSVVQTVIADAEKVITTVGPYVPEIAALAAMAAHKGASASGGEMQSDWAALRSHAR